MGASDSTIESDQSGVINEIDINNNEILKFHEICGNNIIFESNKSIAKRKDGFCNAIVLTNRHIRLNEVVFIKFTNIANCWRGHMRFGLTCKDPAINEHDIKTARYVCPDLTNRRGYWAKALCDEIKNNDILYFYINKNASVYYGINNIFKGAFFDDVNINPNVKLWPIFDIYGNTTTIELIDPSKSGIQPVIININQDDYLQTSLNTTTLDESSSSSTLSNDNIIQLDSLIHNFRGLHDNDLNHSIATNTLLSPKIIDTDKTDLSSPLLKLFHHSYQEINNNFNNKLFGKCIKFDDKNKIASRSKLNSRNAYVFIDRQIIINNSLCVQVTDVDTKNDYSNLNEISLSFGCTNCPLENLKQINLPDESYDLLNRQEYWIVNKNILNSASVGDELCFLVDSFGNIEYKVNGKQRTKCLFNVDITQKLYFFFNLCGKTTSIRLIQPCRQKHDNKNFQLSYKTTIHDLNKINNIPNKIKKPILVKEECLICLEAQIECVIYSCGHMCMCYNCAVKVLNDKSSSLSSKPLCPICRFEIKDVIRVYKS